MEKDGRFEYTHHEPSMRIHNEFIHDVRSKRRHL